MDEIKKNQLIIDDQKRLSLTGVITVDSFNLEYICLTCVSGRMVINGEGLKITSFSKTTGTLLSEGKFISVKYNVKRVPLVKRIFK